MSRLVSVATEYDNEVAQIKGAPRFAARRFAFLSDRHEPGTVYADILRTGAGSFERHLGKIGRESERERNASMGRRARPRQD